MKRILFMMMAAVVFSLEAFAQPEDYKTQSNKEFAKTISRKNVQVLDVRTPEEFNEKHIPGAVNMDVQAPDFKARIKTLDKKYPVAVYCRSGVRSRKAAVILAKEGFRVINLDKGITGWNGPTDPPAVK